MRIEVNLTKREAWLSALLAAVLCLGALGVFLIYDEGLHQVAGQVLDSRGEPLPEASVRLLHPATALTTGPSPELCVGERSRRRPGECEPLSVDEDGWFRSGGIPGGTWYVMASAPGHRTRITAFEPGMVRPLAFLRAGRLYLRLEPEQRAAK